LKEDQEREQKAQLQKEIVTVIVTEVLDGGHFYVQIKGEEHAELEKLMQQLQQSKKPSPPDWVPKRGDKVVALFSVDNKWYRGYVRDVLGSKTSDDPTRFAISYVDYGNVEIVTANELRPLEPAFLRLPPQAKECYLACIRVPRLSEDFGREAASFFKELVWEKTMWGNIEYRDHDGRLFLSLGDPQSQVHVNAALVHAGFARVQNKSDKTLALQIAKLKTEEEFAKKSHLNIWRYGDFSDDEDEAPARGSGRRGRQRK